MKVSIRRRENAGGGPRAAATAAASFSRRRRLYTTCSIASSLAHFSLALPMNGGKANSSCPSIRLAFSGIHDVPPRAHGSIIRCSSRKKGAAAFVPRELADIQRCLLLLGCI